MAITTISTPVNLSGTSLAHSIMKMFGTNYDDSSIDTLPFAFTDYRKGGGYVSTEDYNVTTIVTTPSIATPLGFSQFAGSAKSFSTIAPFSASGYDDSMYTDKFSNPTNAYTSGSDYASFANASYYSTSPGIYYTTFNFDSYLPAGAVILEPPKFRYAAYVDAASGRSGSIKTGYDYYQVTTGIGFDVKLGGTGGSTALHVDGIQVTSGGGDILTYSYQYEEVTGIPFNSTPTRADLLNNSLVILCTGSVGVDISYPGNGNIRLHFVSVSVKWARGT